MARTCLDSGTRAKSTTELETCPQILETVYILMVTGDMVMIEVNIRWHSDTLGQVNFFVNITMRFSIFAVSTIFIENN